MMQRCRAGSSIRLFLLGIFFFMAPFKAFAEPLNELGLKVLELSLAKAKARYILKSVFDEDVPQERALTEMRRNRHMNIYWTMTTSAREENFRIIRIPIDKGLIGWRIFFIKKGQETKFEKIKNLSELKKLLPGQGHDWPDGDILKANGFQVFESSHFEGLFAMLKSERIDFIPRSLIEIWKEREDLQDKDIVIEKTIALHYPAPVYFFVSKSEQKLADTIASGLQAAINDGSFDKLFNEWAKPILLKAKLEERKIFNLKNPLLPQETPPLSKKYWYQIK